MAFQEIQNDIWIPENPGDSIIGIFVGKEDDVGTNKSKLYHLDVNGRPISLWGSTVLDGKMLTVKPGNKIKVLFEGLGEKQPGKNPPKIFKVYVDNEEKMTPSSNLDQQQIPKAPKVVGTYTNY